MKVEVMVLSQLLDIKSKQQSRERYHKSSEFFTSTVWFISEKKFTSINLGNSIPSLPEYNTHIIKCIIY